MENICFHRIIDNGRKPTPEQCQEGQLILQLAEKKIYTKDHTGEIISIGGGDSGVPVGGIVAFPKLPVPHNFLVCNGGQFDKNIFTALYEYLGKDTVPDFTDRYLKHIGNNLSPLSTVPWMIPQHTHEGKANSKDLGSKKITGGAHGHNATFRGNKLPNHKHKTKMGTGVEGHRYKTNAGGSQHSGWVQMESDSVSAGTPSGSVTVQSSSHEHNLTLGSHEHSVLTTGIRESINKGDSLEVDHIGVVYAIKAYDSIDDPEQLTAQNVVNQLPNFFTKAGGVLTGNVEIEKSDHAKLGINAGTNKNAELWLTEDKKNHGAYVRYCGAGDNSTEFGTRQGGVNTKFMSVARGSREVRFEATPKVANHEIYHKGNKPTPAEIGAATKEDILAEMNKEGVPVGIPFPWPNTIIPSGYLECRGQTFDKSRFKKLAAAYPSGRLPDMRDQVIKGHGSGRAPLTRQGARNPLSRVETSYPRNSSTNQSVGVPQNGWCGWFYGGGGSGPGNSIRLHSVEPYVRSVSFMYIVKAA